jgi:integrase
MPVRELNTSTKIETAAAPPKPGFRLYHAPRASGHAGITLRVVRSSKGTVSRILQVIVRGPDRRERRVTVSHWPPGDGATLASVLARACAIRDRIKQGLDPYPPAVNEEPTQPTLEAIWSRYAKTHGLDKKPRSHENEHRLWRLHVGPQLGSKKPSDLSFDVLKRWYTGVAASSVANANRAHTLLNAMFNAAKRKWKEPWATSNPMEVLSTHDRIREIPRSIVITREQHLKLIECIRQHPADSTASVRSKSPAMKKKGADAGRLAQRQSANCLLLIALTGCRKSEALDAKWGEFDLDQGYWTIPATRTKQKKMTRVPLLPEAHAHLHALYSTRVSDTLLFPQARDATRSQDTLKRSWRTIITRAGLTAVTNLEDGTTSEFRIHDLRHNFGTMAVEAGVAIEVVAGLLGHSQISTTQRYAHVHDRILKAGVDKMVSHFGANTPKAAAE